MSPKFRDLIHITSSGKILVITDIHGNLEDFKRYESIFKGHLDQCKVVLTGDFIHEPDNNYDGSVEILERVKCYNHQYPNFHVLLGNHEWAHLADEPAYKMGVDQKKSI
ncbi:MAG: metallophosphoesterase [Methanobacterium sp.]|nr:metallophosphoesterase [Methanobacterium sp.]